MIIRSITVAITALASHSALAQDAPTKSPSSVNTISMAERKASIPRIEEHIKDRRNRLTELSQDVLRLDERLETKVDKIVHKLASLSDSTDSRYKISQLKMATMEKLVESAKKYQSNRTILINEIKKKQASQPKDLLENDLKYNDSIIEKRIAQILLLSNSFTPEKEVDKYTTNQHYGLNSNGYFYREINPEYRQSKRDEAMDKKQRDATKKALEKSIKRIASLENEITQKLKNEQSSKEYLRLLESEQAHYAQVLKIRKTQLIEMTTSELSPTDTVSASRAKDIENALDDAMADFKSDIRLIKQKHSEIVAERRQIQKLESNLDARKKWLQDNQD